MPVTPPQRQKVRFPSGYTACAAWHYAGADGACVVMAAGTGVAKEPGTDRLASRFHEAGFSVLAIDFRRLGESGGPAGRGRPPARRSLRAVHGRLRSRGGDRAGVPVAAPPRTGADADEPGHRMTSHEIDLSAGTIAYEDTGGDGPAIVLLGGLLMDSTLYADVIERLAPDHRCIAPTLPMGAHRHPMREDADLTPRGLARL